MQTLAMSFNDAPVRQRFRHAQQFLAIRKHFQSATE